MKEKAQFILRNTFGYSSFREKQEDVILNVLQKRDTLAVMPTGSGKSLCYQIPALIFEGLTIVVSPLISLMQDQVDQLVESGVEAVLLNSSISQDRYFENVQKIKNKAAKLLYVAPETLLKPQILEILSSIQIACFTIDEAHCISEWGHDFRPEYRRLVEVRTRFPSAVCVALTATATKRVREDIKHILSLGKSFDTFITSFDRKNLFIEVVEKTNAYKQTLDFINKFPNQSGIIYCFSRKQVDDLYLSLFEAGYSVKPYHAGLNESERIKNQQLFIRDDIQIMVATVAFGMGINKPNVRFVLHFDLPKNIESYYQEIGRAGRDGLDSHCLMLFSYSDTQKIRYFINQKSPDEQRIANIHLNSLVDLAETDECRRGPMLRYFGEDHNKDNCGFCDNCTSEKKELNDITIEAQKFLSCVKRTGEMYGASHIIDVLRGSEAKKVIDNNHHHLSTYKIGTEYSKAQWQHLSRQFIKNRLLFQDQEFGGLKLTQKAYQCFKGEVKIYGTIKDDVPKPAKNKRITTDLDYNNELFDILRSWRKEIADEHNVPPYVIFSDKTLIEISAYFPTTKDSILNIFGIGASKYEKYGDIVLNIIKDFVEKNEIKTTDQLTMQQTMPPINTLQSSKEPKYITLGKMYNTGKNITDIAEFFDIKEDTVINNLYTFLFEGNKLTSPNFLNYISINSNLIDKAIKSFDNNGTIKLKPVFEDLEGAVSYDDLKLLRLHYLSIANNS